MIVDYIQVKEIQNIYISEVNFNILKNKQIKKVTFMRYYTATTL